MGGGGGPQLAAWIRHAPGSAERTSIEHRPRAGKGRLWPFESPPLLHLNSLLCGKRGFPPSGVQEDWGPPGDPHQMGLWFNLKAEGVVLPGPCAGTSPGVVHVVSHALLVMVLGSDPGQHTLDM